MTTLSATITGMHPAANDSNRFVWTKRVVRAIKQKTPRFNMCGYRYSDLLSEWSQRNSFSFISESVAWSTDTVVHLWSIRKLLLLSAMPSNIRRCRSIRFVWDEMRKCGLDRKSNVTVVYGTRWKLTDGHFPRIWISPKRDCKMESRDRNPTCTTKYRSRRQQSKLCLC